MRDVHCTRMHTAIGDVCREASRRRRRGCPTARALHDARQCAVYVYCDGCVELVMGWGGVVVFDFLAQVRVEKWG